MNAMHQKNPEGFVKVDIKNIPTKVFIYCNESFFGNNTLDRNVFEILTDEESFKNAQQRLKELIDKHVLCGKSLNYNSNIPDLVDYDLHCAIVIISDLEQKNIFSFAFITINKDTFKLSYGEKRGKYIYAEIICSNENAKYGGEKILHALFQIGKEIGINIITLSANDDAVRFYEKYGFIESGLNHTKFLNFENNIIHIYINPANLEFFKNKLPLNNEKRIIHTNGIFNNDQVLIEHFLKSDAGFQPGKNEFEDDIEDKVKSLLDNCITLVVNNNTDIYGIAFLRLVENGLIAIEDIYTKKDLDDSTFVLRAIKEFCQEINVQKIYKIKKPNFYQEFYLSNGFRNSGFKEYLVHLKLPKRKIQDVSGGKKKTRKTQRKKKLKKTKCKKKR
jgi:hypothetical protein